MPCGIEKFSVTVEPLTDAVTEGLLVDDTEVTVPTWMFE
jgi:hypothetical protein